MRPLVGVRRAVLVQCPFLVRTESTCRDSRPETTDMIKWYYKTGKGEVGPISPQQVRNAAASGKLGPEDLVRRGDDGKWHHARSIRDLAFASANEPPPSESDCHQPRVEPPPIPLMTTNQYFLSAPNGQNKGPFSPKDIADLIAQGILRTSTELVDSQGKKLAAGDVMCATRPQSSQARVPPPLPSRKSSPDEPPPPPAQPTENDGPLLTWTQIVMGGLLILTSLMKASGIGPFSVRDRVPHNIPNRTSRLRQAAEDATLVEPVPYNIPSRTFRDIPSTQQSPSQLGEDRDE